MGKGKPRIRDLAGATHAKAVLTEAHRAFLARHGWDQWVRGGLGVWVSASEQMFRIIRGRDLVWQAQCSTAAAGVGSQNGSYKTPLGWHSVAEKIGEGARWGQVFRERRPVGRVWLPGEHADEGLADEGLADKDLADKDLADKDLILTRILVLSGEEPGRNKGGNVDSHARRIYVHGTNAEADIGKPVSRGCIRLTNDDIIGVFDLVPEGAPLLITYGD